MARLTNKKINKARMTYETYCKVNTLEKTKEATGLAINTIRKYIALVEELDNKSKLSTKDRYYNTKDNKEYIYIKDNKDNINKDIDEVKNNINDSGAITPNNISLKDTKNKILLSKLDTISTKYLGYLDNPSDKSLEKTSLKDRAVIAGILLDKKILLEHKQADVIRNQSVIFNLFGSNKELASFISDSMSRQRKLEARPVKKYELATGK
ncbi:MAG: hypothetical protein H8E13_00900 [Actinobacteria bacterium]|nr:hypothetical protein [Actinomycetota bacterium]